MERTKTYDVPTLNIDEAIKASQNYIKELEELKRQGLTNKQAETLIRLTQELISGTESEE